MYMAVELEQRVKSVLVRLREDGDDDYVKKTWTFAQRAEAYYSERPQLMSLLQQLKNASQVRQRPASRLTVDKLVEEVVTGSVQMHLLDGMANEGEELRRKVELQRSLVEVLESERMVLLKDNATLRYHNHEITCQAAELATCLLRLRRAHIHRRKRGVRSTVSKWVGKLHRLLLCGTHLASP